MTSSDPQNVITLPSGKFDVDYPRIERVLELIRLGSQGSEGGYDSCIIPSSPTDPIPVHQSQNGTETTVPDTARSAPLNESHTHIPTRTLAIPTDRRSKASSICDLDTSDSSVRSSSPYFLSLNADSQQEANMGKIRSASSRTMLNTQPTAGEGVQQATLNPYTVSATSERNVSTVAVQVEIHDTEITADQDNSTQFKLYRSQGTPNDASQGSSDDDSSRPNRTTADTDGSNLQSRSSHLGVLSLVSRNDLSTSASIVNDSFCPVHPHLASPQNILSHKYAQELEVNFAKNHLYGDTSQSLDKAMVDIIRQGQVRVGREEEGVGCVCEDVQVCVGRGGEGVGCVCEDVQVCVGRGGEGMGCVCVRMCQCVWVGIWTIGCVCLVNTCAFLLPRGPLVLYCPLCVCHNIL